MSVIEMPLTSSNIGAEESITRPSLFRDSEDSSLPGSEDSVEVEYSKRVQGSEAKYVLENKDDEYLEMPVVSIGTTHIKLKN